MTSDANENIGRASDIIELFGGIRPMSAKTGIPVTTIQGWKQRNVIPANRRYELVDAANRHGINLSDLLMDIAGEKSAKSEDEINSDEIVMQARKMDEAQLDPDLRPASNHTAMMAAGALILAAVVFGAVMAIAPKINTISAQDVRIRELEQQIAAMRDAQSESRESAPPEINEKLVALQGQVGQLTVQAKSYAGVITDLQSGTMQQRLSKLEGHVGGLLQQANAFGLQDVVQKIQLLQSSPEGVGKVDGLISAFVGVAGTAKTPDDLAASFTQLRDTNPDVAETFKNVAPEDMKAAVMLMGMSQLRESLARDNNSFDTDLQLLKLTLAKDDPALQAAIDKLAPQSKAGILTPNGLSKELRGLTGDIVQASLTGQDISIEEKAKARFGQMVKVEKDGQQISGTETQITIAEAQKKLDAGDVAGAVQLLQQIQGPAAAKTQPIVSAAQATMMASEVQQLLGQNLLLKLKGLTGNSVPYTASGSGAGQIVDQIKSIGTNALQKAGQ